MRINKSNYEDYKTRVNKEELTSMLARNIENGNVSYFEIFNDNNEYVKSFEVYDKDNNWLAIDVHNKESIIDNKELMILILSELKKYYSCLVLRIDEEFDKRIKKAKSYGFVVKSVKQQGIYHYIELKIEL